MVHDFSNSLIRSSCISQIMAEPRSVADKKAGKLSATAKTFLIKMYAWEKYGRVKDLQTKFTDKGKIVEEDGITLICLLDKKMLSKNDVRLNNKYFTGEPDVYEGKSIKKADRITDVKCSWDLETFLSKITGFLDKAYWWQGQGYMDLSGASEFECSYCLVNTPQMIIEEEKKKLFYKMGVATEQNIDYLAACAEIEKNMLFDDIPMEERRIKFEINKDKEAIERAREKVVRCREWLAEFQTRHLAGGFLNSEEGEDDN